MRNYSDIHNIFQINSKVFVMLLINKQTVSEINHKKNMPKKDFGKLRPASSLKKSLVKLVSVIEVSM